MSQSYSTEDLDSLSIYQATKMVQQSLATQLDRLISNDFCVDLSTISAQLMSKQSNDNNATNPSVQFENNISEIKMLDQCLKSFPESTNELRLIDEYLSTGIRTYRN